MPTCSRSRSESEGPDGVSITAKAAANLLANGTRRAQVDVELQRPNAFTSTPHENSVLDWK
jgi:hypothetical protein